ncbi:MAG: orotate phosphoribosyltransferase [Candidatus Pacebacteria bacterium]|nr:orotate phosphoribosyltransferase [Candidatus Paceibacterota bacterium]MBP9852163.1 orotate phosphoribosyltransferase [Candidatus Paceibacterota bacterium]
MKEKGTPTLESIRSDFALKILSIEAIVANTATPFTWASGWKSPMYNDNRLALSKPEIRDLAKEGLIALIKNAYPDYSNIWIAGVATAGIPLASIIADQLELPLIYVRDKKKDHGMENRIEGIKLGGLHGKTVVVIEDLISTGGSSVDAVQAIRDAGGIVNHCFSIFTYGFPKAAGMFAGTESFSKDPVEKKFLLTPCKTDSVLDFPLLLQKALEANYFSEDDKVSIEKWSRDPEGWSNEWKAAHSEIDFEEVKK